MANSATYLGYPGGLPQPQTTYDGGATVSGTRLTIGVFVQLGNLPSCLKARAKRFYCVFVHPQFGSNPAIALLRRTLEPPFDEQPQLLAAQMPAVQVEVFGSAAFTDKAALKSGFCKPKTGKRSMQGLR